MNRSRRSNRFGLASGLRKLFGKEKPGAADHATSRLVQAAGAAEQAFEALENRQLLFTLTIGDPRTVFDPFTGLGTITQEFHYFLPYIASPQTITPVAPTIVDEDFNANDPGAPVSNVPTGFVFQGAQERLQVTHNLDVLQLTQITAGENQLSVVMGPGQFLSLGAVGVPTGGGAPVTRSVSVMSMDIRGGLNASDVTVQFLDEDGMVIDSVTGAALNALGIPSVGPIRRYTFAAAGGELFASLRFVSSGGAPSDAFQIDNVSFSVPGVTFGPFLQSLVFGGSLVFTGPMNASIQVLDLYGREMRANLLLGIASLIGEPPGLQNIIADPDSNGVPNWNDGIGRINITGTNALSAVTLFGGTCQTGNTAVFLPTNPIGNFDAMETAGFGHIYTIPPGGQPVVTGLPPGSGSIVVGSPWLRSQGAYNPGGGIVGPNTPIASGFTRADQGVFVTGGANIGSLYIHGLVYGSSQYSGSVGRLILGVAAGSNSINGDLTAFISSGDAGIWADDDGTPTIKTNGHLTVGRTVGEIAIGGRSLMNVTVIGDLSRPSIYQPRDIFRYFEKEWSPNIPTNLPTITTINAILSSNNYQGLNNIFAGASVFFGRLSQSIVFNTGYFRNDAITAAEWIGTAATSVQINGELGFADPVQTRQDPSDVYAFAADGSQDIVVDLSGGLVARALGVYARIVDHSGRTLVATPGFENDPRTSTLLRYRPETAGVYYLVISTSGDATNTVDVPYVVTVSGMAASNLGAYRTAGGSGAAGALANTFNVLSGSVGSVRIGMGWVNGAGAQADPSAVYNASGGENVDASMSFRGSTFTIPGNLYNIITGSDIDGGGLTINVGSQVGTIVTGMSPLIGVDADNGDLRNLTLTVGGSIAMFDVRGTVGIDRDSGAYPVSWDLPSSVFIRTGTDSRFRGDIGMFRVGSHVGAGTLSLRTPNGSVVGAFLVSQDRADATGINQGIYGSLGGNTGLDLQLGMNSDLRFFDTPLIWQQNIPGVETPLFPGQPVSFSDDGGGQVQIQIIGGTAGPGSVKVVPVSGSLGVAVGRIEVDLTGGARLQITGQGPVGSNKVISIGHIIITGADAASSIGVDGNIQVDVWRIEQTGGDGFLSVTNLTPLGDVVAIDTATINSVDIRTGDLGRTQMPAWGPKQIGPFLGIGRGGAGENGERIGIPQNVMTGFWNGNLYRPIDSSNGNAPPGSWLDDVGSPVDPYLNGLITRGGNIINVAIGGAVGDVIAGGGDVIQVIANADNITPQGRFDGIIGNIYGNRISLVEIGDGLARGVIGSPLATTSIAANDDILTVRGTLPGAFISGLVNAANNVIGNTDPNNFPTDGVELIDLRGAGGNFVDAWIGSMTNDNFWSGFYQDDGQFRGTINLLRGNMGNNLLRSTVTANFINNVTLTGGFFDASTMQSASDINRIETAGYRNSTITGGDLEIRSNLILVGRNLGTLTTFGRTGDIKDLTLDVLGRTTEISARFIDRSSLDSDISIENLVSTASIRGSSITTGLLTKATIENNLASSRVSVAGPLEDLTVGDAIINSAIASTGPDGRIDKITARTGMSGSIFSAGPIDTIEVTEGDLTTRITTVTNQHGTAGDIKLLKASRDLNITTDISGTVEEMVAGRHIGNQSNPGVILVRGGITNVDISNGQLYSDLRIGQSLTKITIGAVPNFTANSHVGLGSIIAFGRIEEADISGDFGGKISSASGGIGIVRITDGSLLFSASIIALDGDIGQVIITNGHLFGDIHADYILFSVRVEGSDDGVMGDIGVNPNLSQGVGYDAFRNQLPPGVLPTPAIQGPRITAGRNLGRITVTNGSIFEATIYAARAIGTIDVNGNITKDSQTLGQGTVIAAGSSIFAVLATGNIGFTDVLAGIRGFGDDGRPGGTGTDADTVQSGRITTVHADGTGTSVKVSAGMNAGPDGQYNTFDESVALGISYVREVTLDGGVQSSVSVFADSPTLNTSANVVKAGTTFVNVDGDLSGGSPIGTQLVPDVAFAFNWGGVSGTILYSGPGKVYWDATGGKVHLVNTKLTTTLTVNAGGSLTNFDIATNDDASMGEIEVNAPLAGDSDIVVDAYCAGISIGDFSGTGQIKSGMNIKAIETGNFIGGFIVAAFWARNITITGNYGLTGVTGEARIDALASSSIAISGTNSGLINIERDLQTLSSGAMDGAQVRAGNTLNGGITTGSMFEVRVSVGDALGPVAVTGDATDVQILAGGDLGSDVVPGGTGFNADRATTGSIASLTVGGNFARSSLVAGMLRGPDGYFGTTDDQVGPGRSNIGNVTIGGTQVGSNVFTEQYRISSTGTLGTVMIGGQVGTDQLNFKIASLATEPTPIRVVDLQITQESNDWKATFFFNQPLDTSTFGPALTVSEVRNGVLVSIPLVQGVDYFVGEYNSVENSIAITFSRDITDRNLVPQGGIPGPGTSTPGDPDPALAGPGTYRFVLSADVLRARVVNARLDGDSNGFAASNEDYSQDDIVGDAGDKFSPEVINVATGTNPDELIDIYGPVDLDVVLDNNLTPDGLPDTNLVYTLRGTIGDHPDNNVNTFRAGGDTDIYRITLQAGQILRLGAMEGPARFAGRFLYNSGFVQQGGNSADTVQLPVDVSSILLDITSQDSYLIKTTGTYYIVMTNTDLFEVGGVVPNIDPGSGDTGNYKYTVEVFDDGNSGFNASTNSGNGTPVVNAPAAIVFAGPNGIFQNPGDPGYDDLAVVPIGDYRFTLDPGADGTRGTGDDIVSGANNTGITSTRVGNDLTSQINSSIGPGGHTGVPGAVASDVDIYHLNNGLPIAAGRLITITVKLADLGADLGSFSQVSFTDFRGAVQFGVFDTTGATSVDDANLLLSPTDFLPRAGEPGEIARNGQMAYGYDANGDFFISFITPDRLGGTAGQAGTYAVYLQGVYNTDYSIVVSQSEAAPVLSIPQTKQNIFIETRGGTLDWLEAGGLTSKLLPFASSVLGFTGNVGGMPVDQYILTNLATRLQAIYNSTGLNVVVSTNPNAFEFEDFSTVFLTASNDPTTVTGTANFGYSQHSDSFNLDKNDEGVVFLPSLSSLGYSPSQADVDNFILSLAAAVGRRAGELMGLRITANDSDLSAPIDIMSANSVFNVPGVGNAYGYPDASRALSTRFDSVVSSDFFLGRQNAFQLLDKFLTP